MGNPRDRRHRVSNRKSRGDLLAAAERPSWYGVQLEREPEGVPNGAELSVLAGLSIG
jgi:hypothetical protein